MTRIPMVGLVAAVTVALAACGTPTTATTASPEPEVTAPVNDYSIGAATTEDYLANATAWQGLDAAAPGQRIGVCEAYPLEKDAFTDEYGNPTAYRVNCEQRHASADAPTVEFALVTYAELDNRRGQSILEVTVTNTGNSAVALYDQAVVVTFEVAGGPFVGGGSGGVFITGAQPGAFDGADITIARGGPNSVTVLEPGESLTAFGRADNVQMVYGFDERFYYQEEDRRSESGFRIRLDRDRAASDPNVIQFQRGELMPAYTVQVEVAPQDTTSSTVVVLLGRSPQVGAYVPSE